MVQSGCKYRHSHKIIFRIYKLYKEKFKNSISFILLFLLWNKNFNVKSQMKKN